MSGTTLPPAAWLRGEIIGLRAAMRDDAATAAVWHEHGRLTRDESEALLVSGERVPWGNNPVLRLMIVRLAGGDVAGGVVLRRIHGMIGDLSLVLGDTLGAERRDIAQDVLGLIVPWALGELGLMTVSIRIPEDDASLAGAASATGMRQAVRLREAIARPEGRVDLLMFEQVNPDWGRRWRGGRDTHA